MVKRRSREGWKGYSEFMFWGCFTYDKKGPCHVYKPEIRVEKQMAAQKISELNAKLEPLLQGE